MKIIVLTTSIFVSASLMLACSQSEFAGEAGQGVRLNKKKTPVDNPNDTDTPGTNDNPGTDDGLMTDDGGEIKLVDAELTIERHGDGAHFQNCMKANIQGQEPVDIGCNRPGRHPASYGPANPFKSAKIKLLTNTCNVLQLSMTSNGNPNIKTSGRVFNSGTKPRNGPGYVIDQIPNGFKVYANDNYDDNWGDLSLSITSPGNPKIKFTIEGTNVPCP